MFLFDPKLDEIYVGNIIKTYVSSNICFRFDPTLSVSSLTLTLVMLSLPSLAPTGAHGILGLEICWHEGDALPRHNSASLT